MKNFYFDICAIAIYLLILFVYFSRRMTRFPAFRTFFIMAVTSLICSILDIWMEFVVNPLPLSETAVKLGMMISFSYKLLRNAGMVIYLIFICTITKTDHRLRTPLGRIVLWTPNMISLVLLIQNFFTRNVFTVTQEGGYARGPLLIVLYVVSILYGVFGTGYCIACKKYLSTGKWVAILSVYVMMFLAIFVQAARAELMVEMFSTAIAMLMIMMVVMRPEETIDSDVGVETWKTFQRDVHNYLISKRKIGIVVFRLPNGEEDRIYMGDARYTEFTRNVIENIRTYFSSLNTNFDIYYEHPESIYVIFTDGKRSLRDSASMCLAYTKKQLNRDIRDSVWFDAQLLVINCPEDLNDDEGIFNLCHRFPTYGPRSQRLFTASDIVNSRDFEIQNNINEILERALNNNGLQMYYQPIYDVKDGSFHSAEALARLTDDKYGVIPPNIFIPAAERTGMIIPLGKAIIESVFRFIGENDLQKIGLNYIEINLSVEQCLQHDLPDQVSKLQEKYGISPNEVNFEITESMLESIGNIMDKNILKLSHMGYSFSLDDYGVGYSNIQRLRRLPLSLIKVDKTLIDDIFTEEGETIIRSTVNMMQGINKKLVMEGAETKETVKALSDLSCEYIQGFYFSKPLPKEEFLNFMKEKNLQAA